MALEYVPSINCGKYIYMEYDGSEKLDLSSFDTKQITHPYEMNDMFVYCSELKILDLSGWDLSNLDENYMAHPFYACKNLIEIIIASCNNETIKWIKKMVYTDLEMNEKDLEIIKNSIIIKKT